MPRPNELPEWLAKELMQRWDALFRLDGTPRIVDESPQELEEKQLRELGYDGSRLRRRYWKKVRFEAEGGK